MNSNKYADSKEFYLAIFITYLVVNKKKNTQITINLNNK
jgi:hypothetical protein